MVFFEKKIIKMHSCGVPFIRNAKGLLRRRERFFQGFSNVINFVNIELHLDDEKIKKLKGLLGRSGYLFYLQVERQI